MLGAIVSQKLKAGTVYMHGKPYIVEADTEIPDGRGPYTTFFHSEFSKNVPPLYWYRFYAGFYTKCFQCLGFSMTQCGNVFVGILETMCNTPKLDPVIYFTNSNIAAIIDKNVRWRRDYKLAPAETPLIVDLEVVVR
jgi:hypothetical protein